MKKSNSYVILGLLIFSVISFSGNAFGYYPTFDVETGIMTLNSTNVTGFGSFNITLRSISDDLDVFTMDEITQVQQGPQDKVPSADIESLTLRIPKLQLLVGKFDSQWYEVDMIIVANDSLQFIVEKATITTQPEDYTPPVTPSGDASQITDNVPTDPSETEVEMESSGDVTDEDKGFFDPTTKFTVKVHNLTSSWRSSVSIYFLDWWESTTTYNHTISAKYTRNYWWYNNYDTDFVLKYHDGRAWWRAGGTSSFRYNGRSQTVTCRIKEYYDTTWRKYLLICDCKPGDYSANSVWW